jgi:hypothetical protein
MCGGHITFRCGRSIQINKFTTARCLLLICSLGFSAGAAAQGQPSQFTPEQRQAALIAQQRLLCIQVSGADLTDMAGQMKFQRCMKDPPRQAMIQNTLGANAANAATAGRTPPLLNGPVPNLVTPQGPLVHPVRPVVQPAATAPTATHGDACAQGYVWREAAKNDHVCVTPMLRRLAAQDNAAAARRVVPGSDTCRAGFVWREAFPADHVCVTAAARAQAAADNAQTQARQASP